MEEVYCTFIYTIYTKLFHYCNAHNITQLEEQINDSALKCFTGTEWLTSEVSMMYLNTLKEKHTVNVTLFLCCIIVYYVCHFPNLI